MADIIDKKQKLMLEYLISNRELFVKAIRLVKPEFFEKPLDRVVEYITTHFGKYNTIAEFVMIEADTNVLLENRPLDPTDYQYALDEIEKHCQEQAMMSAVLESVELIEQGNLSEVVARAREALRVKLDTSIGTDVFEDPAERIRRSAEWCDARKTGLHCIDDHVGEIGRGELGIVCAISGGGKSLMLSNLGLQLANQGLNGLFISLELSEELYAKRLDTIITNHDIRRHLEDADIISQSLKSLEGSMGSMVVKRMPNGTTATEIRAFIMEYQIQKGYLPDFVMVDYMAGMGVEGMKSLIGSNKFDTDKHKSEALREIAHELWIYMFTAAQINREGQDAYLNVSPSYIQGGMSMIQTSDWTVAMVANEEDQDNRVIKTVPMKLRNAELTSKIGTCYKNPMSLRFTNNPPAGTNSGSAKRIQTTSSSQTNTQPQSKVKSALAQLR